RKPRAASRMAAPRPPKPAPMTTTRGPLGEVFMVLGRPFYPAPRPTGKRNRRRRPEELTEPSCNFPLDGALDLRTVRFRSNTTEEARRHARTCRGHPTP